MASAQQDICAICLEQPKTPRSLPTCTHLLCDQCLNSYINRHASEVSVACPTCTIACPIRDVKPEEGAVEASPAELTKKEMCLFCSYKGVNAEAKFICETCSCTAYGERTALCLGCATSHNTKPRFRGHTVKTLSSHVTGFSRCQDHGGRPLMFLCMDCDTTVCDICVDINHDDHRLTDIADVKKQLSDNIGKLNEDHEHVARLCQEYQDVQKGKEVAISRIQNQVEQAKKELLNEVDKRGDLLLSEIEAKTGGKQIDMDLTSFLEKLHRTAENGQALLAVDIATVEQMDSALSSTDTLVKIRSDARKKIVELDSRLHRALAPMFISQKGLNVGKLEYLQRRRTAPVRLQLGGRYVRMPCYKINTAVPFIREGNKAEQSTKHVAFLEKYSSNCRLQVGSIDNRLASSYEFQESYEGDMIVNNEGNIVIVIKGGFPYLQIIEKDGKQGTRANLPYSRVKSLAQTKTGLYIVLFKESGKCAYVSVLTEDMKLSKGPYLLEPNFLYLSVQNECDLKIVCPESTDLLLILTKREVLAVSLEVKHTHEEFGSDGSIRDLEHYCAHKAHILPPVTGYYIMDICCDGGRVYLCLKQGTHTDLPTVPRSIMIYEAHYANEKWQYTFIPLEDPTGNPFCELQKDELLHFGVHKGTVMCMVYSPIPLAELKESKKPGMNITWYHGQLP